MESEITKAEGRIAPLNKVTPLSKYLAMALFVILPFVGGWIGYNYAPEKVVEVERVVVKEVVNTASIEAGDISESEYRDSLDPGLNAETQVYYSSDLGIAFTYSVEQTGIGPVATFTEGNRVYVYRDVSPTGSSDFVEILEKNPNKSIEETLRENHLPSYEDTCDVAMFPGLENSYVFKRTVDVTPDTSVGKCPSFDGYGQYFAPLGDRDDVYLMIGHGQELVVTDGAGSGENGFYNPWYLSIKSLY
jgi:hypothetical protein